MAMNMDASLRLSAKVDGLNNIVSLNRGLQSVESTAKGVTGAMRGMTGAAAGLSGALGTLAPLLSVAGLAGMVQNTIKAGDSMYDLSQKTGVAVESLAKFKKAAAVSGTDIDTVAKAMNKLNKNIVDAATGNKEAAKGFGLLGLSAQNTNGTLKSASQVMLEVANKFKDMPDNAVKAKAAMLLFGSRMGTELIPMLNMGGAAIDRLSVKMTSAFAQKMDQYSDRLTMLSGKVGALGMDLTIALLPVLETLTDVVSKLVSTFNDLPQPVKDVAIAGAALAIAWGPTVALLRGAIAVFTSLTTAQVAAGAAAAASAPQYAAASSAMSAGAVAAARLAAVLSKLAALGIVTVGVEFLINGARQGQRIEDIAQRLQRGGTGASFDPNVSSRSQVENARRAALQTIQSARQELKNQKPQGWVSAIPLLGPALAGMQGARNTELQGRILDAQTVLKLNPRQFQSNPGGSSGGFTPDLSALESGGGGGKKDKTKDNSKQIKEDIRASAEALAQGRAELEILRQTDPLKKIELQYEEKRRALIAATKKAIDEKTSSQQKANLEDLLRVQLDKLSIERINELTQKYKELKGAGFEAAGSLEQWYQKTEKTNAAMAGLRDGLNSYVEGIGNIRDGVSSLTQNTFKGLEDALVSLTTTGTANFREFAMSIVNETSRMVTRLLIMAPLMQLLKSLIPGSGGGDLLKTASKLSTNVGFFADGGVVTSPTLFKFASGGAGNFGLMAEAGPEAIMPLKRGRDGKLGVASSNNAPITVNVQVDASGSKVQGDQPNAAAFGRMIGAAVQAELIKQKRPGGVL